MTADLVFDEMSQCLAKVFTAQQTIHVPRTLDSEHSTVALDDSKSEEADIVTITLSPQPHVIAIGDTNPAREGFATPSIPSIIADPTMLFALIESALEYENLSNAGKVFDKPPQRNDDDSLSPFIYKESFFISHSSRDCLMPLVTATFFGNEQFTGDALKLSTHNDPNRRKLFGTLEKYDLLLVAYGKPWWLRGNFGLHVRNWFDTGKLIVLVGGTRSTHSVHFLVYLNIASSEFCRNMVATFTLVCSVASTNHAMDKNFINTSITFSFFAITSNSHLLRHLGKVVFPALLLENALSTCSLCLNVLSPANIIFPVSHASSNYQNDLVAKWQNFPLQSICDDTVLPFFLDRNQHTRDTKIYCNISFVVLDRLSSGAIIDLIFVLNRHIVWLQPAFRFLTCTWIDTAQKDMAQLPCKSHVLIGGMCQSILVCTQLGNVVLIDFTHLHGTDVRLPDGKSFAIVYWLVELQQVVTAQRVPVFPHKLVKLCRDNEQVFRTNYIAASWHDRPLGVVKVDFHHAVKDLLSYNFYLDFNSSAALSGGNLYLGDVLNDKVWYSWGGHSKDMTRQVILFSSCILVALDFTKTVLTGASENRISKEFVFLMQNSSHLDALAGTNKFKLIPNAFSVLVQNWLLVMQEELEEYLHAHFVFRSHLLGSRNQPYCNWCSRFNQIINEFNSLYFLHIS
ncbi:hypothetical protein K7X08_019567 [Anisodus acutangulus]|uniref:Uncharacterized protein n=1 Tax=Anisodus acutangulus TaxID=402998 RepID=A0A9Q1RQ53_9SOLA|nr:hypothetical protein K7X08_019567 [Anisodus acutangulus]